jgi:hypothetical protein
MENSLKLYATKRQLPSHALARTKGPVVRSLWTLGMFFLLAGCATTSRDLESLNRQLFETEQQAAQVQAQQNHRIQELEAAQIQAQEEISRTSLLLANLTNQNSQYILEIQTLSRQREQLSQRVVTLESLLRDISLAATLTSPTQPNRPVENQTNQVTTPPPSQQRVEPRETTPTPTMMAEVTAILLGESQFVTVPTVFPGILPGRTERTFIEGSQVFREIERDTNVQVILDQRANYGTRVGMFGEIRQPLLSGPATRPQDLPELWISFQALADRIAANPGINGIEFTFENQLYRLEAPQRRELLQDENFKLERISFPLSTPNMADFIRFISQSSRGSVVMIGETQRVRTQISEIERAALLEVLGTYRELGGILLN